MLWAGADLNCQLLVYQTNTLPLSYTPKFGAEGIEPSMAVPKTAALPLGYAPGLAFRGNSSMARILGFKLRDAGSIPPFPALCINLNASGLEPETGGLKGQCSTN